MDKNTKQEQSYEGSNEENHKDEEYRINNHYLHKVKDSESNYKLKQNKINSNSQQNQRAHSRSRSPCNAKNSKQWISSNAFINFVQDFRQNCTGVRSTKIFQMAGERWKTMSPEQKQPYIKAAMSIRNQKHNQQKSEYEDKLDDTNIEQSKNEDTQKQERTGKKEKKRKEPKKSTKNKSNTESDTDSFASATTGSNTSDDLSDTS